MTKRILYVVHRYAPFPGGSENYVRDMAEETLSRGHEVWVLAGEHKGDLNGVRLTSDYNVLQEKWDLIVVHGGDVNVQDSVLFNSEFIKSPILYLIILPSNSPTCVRGLKGCTYLGCSTKADWEHLMRNGVYNKGVVVRHGIDDKISKGKEGFKKKYGIKTSRMFVSCGGYWHNKAMKELAEVFNKAEIPDTTLVLTGYDNRFGIMPEESEFVKPLMIESRDDVLSAIMEADLYILHSYSEGFGLVLLESMYNNTQWAARKIAGADTMSNYGFTYTTDGELINYIKSFVPNSDRKKEAYEYVVSERLIKNTVDDILQVIRSV